MYGKKPNRYRFLYLVRHGQYVSTDQYPKGELTDLGVKQAQALASHLESTPIDVIWSSTMSRAEQTADIIVREAFGEIEPRRSRLLRERLFPANAPWWSEEWEKRLAPDDLLDRIWKRWMRPSRSERHELLVCHGNLIRAIVTRALGADLDCWWKMSIHNCSITRLVCFDHDTYRLLAFNEHSWIDDDLLTMR